MNKIELLFSDLKKSTSRLEEICLAEQTVANRDSTIKRFEFTFEIVWKMMQSIGEDHREPAAGPKNSIRFGGSIGLINDVEAWMDYHDLRNQTVHIYNEEMAISAYKQIHNFLPLVKSLITNTEKYLT